MIPSYRGMIVEMSLEATISSRQLPATTIAVSCGASLSPRVEPKRVPHDTQATCSYSPVRMVYESRSSVAARRGKLFLQSLGHNRLSRCDMLSPALTRLLTIT